MPTSSVLKTRVFTNADQEVISYDGFPITWRVSVYGVVFKDGKVLLIKNAREKLYDIVDGAMEFGETIEDAFNREGLEEVGVTFVIGKLVYAQSD